MSFKGKRAFIAGIGDDQGYGWAIAKALAEEGCDILIGTWVPVVKVFTTLWQLGKFDESRRLSNNLLMNYLKLYPLDASFETPDEVPEKIKDNKRYKQYNGYTISEVAAQIERDYGKIDMIVHSLANGPEVKHPLLETSRGGQVSWPYYE